MFGSIEVIIENLDCNDGTVLSQLFYSGYNSSADFPTLSEKAYRKNSSIIRNKQVRLVYESVPYGSYAVTVHHDINNNGKMDRNILGMPTEPFGLSNNPRLMFSLPSFDDCKFELDSKLTSIHIVMKKL
jgi:uncharacterized protein (DUF2141 family)